MSEIKIETSSYILNEYCGPARHDGGDYRKLELLTKNGTSLLALNKEEALALGQALISWADPPKPVCGNCGGRVPEGATICKDCLPKLTGRYG